MVDGGGKFKLNRRSSCLLRSKKVNGVLEKSFAHFLGEGNCFNYLDVKISDKFLSLSFALRSSRFHSAKKSFPKTSGWSPFDTII